MSYPRFNIGQVSKMLGIAPETLRYYEKKKIIHTPEKRENGYRTFDVFDVCLLGKAREYLKYGFSLEDTSTMLSSPSIDTTVDRLGQQAAGIRKNIYEELAILHSIENKLVQIQKVQENVGKITLTNRPEIYAIQIFENNHPIIDPDCDQPRWFNNQNVTFPCIHFEGRAFQKMDFSSSAIYMGIFAADASSVGICPNEKTIFFPSRPCLYTTTIGSDHTGDFSTIYAYLNQNNLQVVDDVLWRTVAVHETEAGYQYYREIWIPII